jgi:hypothetical protein
MSFFKKELGTFTIGLAAENEVRLTDRIPQPSRRLPATIAFPFLATSKLLYNFPPPLGQAILKDIHQRIFAATQGKTTEEKNISFLGLLCGPGLTIASRPIECKWIYDFTMFEQKGGYGIELKLPEGNEEFLHKACIDIIWEHFKQRWNLGPILVGFAQEYYTQLMAIGVENLSESYALALGMASQMSGLVAAMFI